MKKNILVAFGGASPEHEVSVLTAHQAIHAINTQHYTILPLYVTKSGRWLTGDALLDLKQFKDLKALELNSIPCTLALDEAARPSLMHLHSKGWFSKPATHPIHVVLTAFHGSDGENGAFQGVFEALNLPYTGSGVLGSAIGMDKHIAKQLAERAGVAVVPSVCFTESEWVASGSSLKTQCEALGFPLIVKPARLGSSIGVTKVNDAGSLAQAIESCFRYDDKLLVEKAIHPLQEVNCSILGTSRKAEASVCEMPVTAAEFLSFQDKYQRSGGSSKGMASADRIIPAPISESLTKQIQQDALTVFKALDCSGVARLDFLIDTTSNTAYFNEINTIPGSFSFYLWDKSGLSYPSLIQKLIDLALEQHRIKNGRVRSYETNLLSEKSVKGIKGLKTSK